MADITDLPVMTRDDAIAAGFAGYNDVPHKPIDVPDGAFTITAKTSEGRRVTFCFLERLMVARRVSSTSSSTIAAPRSPTPITGYHPPSTRSRSRVAASSSPTVDRSTKRSSPRSSC